MVTYYTAITPDNDIVTLACRSLDHALALATIDLHRGYVPARIIDGPRRLNIEHILQAIDERRWALRHGEAST
jgi:hypothetical protein